MGSKLVSSGHSTPGLLAGGYTVVETMIFLAVSTVLFISAITLVSGQQARAEFTYGIQEFAAQMRDISNDVSTGFYHNPNNFTCALNGSGEPRFTLVAPGAGQQGENVNCIFLGKVLQLVPDTADRPEESYRLYTVVGRRQVATVTGKRDVTSLAESFTVPLAPPYCGGLCGSAEPPLVDENMFPNGMEVKWARINGDASRPVGSIGFFSNFVRYGPSDSEDSELVESGSRTISVIPILPPAGNGLNQSINDAAALIHDRTSTSPVNPDGGVVVCIESGNGGYYAILNLGGNLRHLSSNLDIQNGECP